VLPNAAQIDEFHGIPGTTTKAAGASPYQAGNEIALREAGASLADTDIIVMHCIGYNEAMRKVVKQAAKRPVLVSRQLVAHAIDIVLA
jgi:protein AroM